MLDFLRNNTQSTIVYLMFGVIIVVFVFTFNTITPDQACGGAAPGLNVQALYEIGDEVVDTNQLNMVLGLSAEAPKPGSPDPVKAQQYKQLRFARYGAYGFIYRSPWADFGRPASDVSPIQAEKAMDDLVETILVSEQAEKIGLAVSDREISDRLIGTFDYWFDEETGEFQATSYDRMVRFQLGAAPARFERFVRQELLRDKFITLMMEGIDLSDQELQFKHRSTQDKLSLEAVVIDDDTAARLASVTEEEVAAWLPANQKAVETFYEENKATYDKPERVGLRGLFVRAPNKARIEAAPDEAQKTQLTKEREDARIKAEGFWQQIADSTEVAAEKAEAAKPESAADTPQPAKDAIAAASKAGVAVSAEAFSAVASENSDHTSSKDAGGLFDEPRDRERLGRWPFGMAVVEPVFGLEVGQMTSVIEVDSGFWIIRQEAKLAAEKKELADVRQEIAQILTKKEKAGEYKKTLADTVFNAAQGKKDSSLDDILAEVNTGLNLSDDTAGLSATETGSFARVQAGSYGLSQTVGQVPTIGDAPQLAKAAFKSTGDSVLLDQVFEVDGGKRLVIARVTAREPAPELDDSAKQSLRDSTLRNKQRLVYRAWYDQLLTQAVNDGRVGPLGAWNVYVDQARRDYIEAGGKLGEAQPPAEANSDG